MHNLNSQRKTLLGFRAASPRIEVSVGDSLLAHSRNECGKTLIDENLSVQTAPTNDRFHADDVDQSPNTFNAQKLIGHNVRVHRVLVTSSSKQQYFLLCPKPDCNKLFVDVSTLRSHMLFHFNSRLHKRNMDKQLNEYGDNFNKSANKSILNKEKEKTSIKSTIIDDALAAVGVTRDQLKKTTVTPGCRWICPYQGCSLTFKTLYLVKNHLMIHYDLKPFKCTYGGCKWAFRTLYKLNCHSTVHNIYSKSPYACTYAGCNKKFTTKFNLSAHKKLHDRLRTHQLTCPANNCNKSFLIHVDLENHLKLEHLPQHALHKCSFCEKRFWWSSSLKVHSRTHKQSLGNLVCDWPGCGRRFALPCDLRYHFRTHTGDRPYKCTFPSCTWAFSSSGKLRRHAQGHEVIKKRPYNCEICGNSFLRSDHLREHLSRHFSDCVRKVQCDYPECKKIFLDKSSVYAHKNQDHSKVKTYESIKILDKINSSPSKETEEETLSSRSARTHVPWHHKPHNHSQLTQVSNIEESQNSSEKKHGNPLVCGDLNLETSIVNSNPILSAMPLSELGSEISCSSNDLLLQDLSDGVLYAAEEDASFHVLLLNEESIAQ